MWSECVSRTAVDMQHRKNAKRKWPKSLAKRAKKLIFVYLSYFALKSRMRDRNRAFDVRKLSMGDTSECPTLDDVLNTVGTDWFRSQVWNDRTCMAGCTLPCTRAVVPCCTVRKSTGLLKQAVRTCLRQVDNNLLPRIQKSGTRVLQYCQQFITLPLNRLNCSTRVEVVPRIVHTISSTTIPPTHVKHAVNMEKGFVYQHMSDSQAEKFIQKHCSQKIAAAYKCIKPPAFRADLYRFCALYAVGGLYLDADLVPLVRLEELYSPCSRFSLGYDQAQGQIDIEHIGMQMKVLASVPGSNISLCMLDNILHHVQTRKLFRTPLEFSGPQLLRKCYLQFPDDVAITYIDTRGAAWPYSGLRDGSKILAYERPDPTRHFEEIRRRDKDLEYNDLVQHGDIYRTKCSI